MSTPLAARWFRSPLKALARSKERAKNRQFASGFKPRLENLEDRTVFDVNVTATAGTMGPTNYTTLGAAFAAVNAGTHLGAITIDVVGDTNEGVATAVLNASGSGAASYSSMLIRPSGGAARTITGATTAGNPLIDLNGADNVTIDGLNTGGNSLTISNTTVSATSGTSTIRLQTDATGNTITKSSILGSSTMATTTNGGNIWFGAGAVATGNDNNIISNNNIGPAGVNLPTKLIYGNGSTTTTTLYNSGIQITGNNLFDFFNAAAQSNAVYIAGGNTGWTINNNRIYQTATRTQTAGAIIAGIQAASVTGNDGLTISGNIIGFANSSGTGTTNLVGLNTSSRFYPIYFSSAGTTVASSIQGNTIAGLNLTGAWGTTSTTAGFIGIFISSGLVNIGTTTGNTIGSLTTAGSITIAESNASASEVYGIYFFPSLTSNISNNNVGGMVVSNAGTVAISVYGERAFTSSSFINTFANNTIGSAAAPITNTTSATTSRTIGIYSQSGATVATGNTISNLSTNAPNVGTAAAAAVIGIWSDNSSATLGNNIAQNTIRNLSDSDPAAAVWVTGLHYNGATSGTQTIQRNLIQNLSTASSSATATVNGVYILAGAATYQNNIVAIGGNMTSNSPQINGINEVGGTNNFYHNSVYIGGASVAAGSANSFAFNSAVTANTRNYRDNIFWNARSNAAASGKHYAIRVGGTAANPAGLTSNNNILFANGTGGYVGLFNAVDQTSLANWQSATGNDAYSFAVNPQYNDPTNATPDLHIHPTNATAAEGNGADVGVTDDFDGQTRSGLTPVDVGADAGNFNGVDLSPPNITYSALGNTSLTGDRTFSVTLTDVTGVATGGSAPRVYFNKNGGAYSSTALALQSGTVNNGVWTATISASALGGVTTSDVIRYFVVAQDTLGQLSASPSGGFVGTNVNTVSSPPSTPSQYVIAVAFSGVYNVGTFQTYTSLTNAGGIFEAINNGVLTGNVTINIVSDLASEVGTAPINQWSEDGAGGYTMLIKPSGAARTISGTSTGPAIIKINGADRLTIDGSLSGGTDRSLTITNGNTGGTVLWIASASTTNGANNDVIKNTNISGNVGTVPISGILAGSGVTLGNDAEAPNSNNTIQNNLIFRAQNAMYLRGNTLTPDLNWSVTGNNIGSTVAADKLTFRGMLVGNLKNFTVSDNIIAGVLSSTSSSSTMTGIQVALNIDTGTITRNRISDIKQSNTTGWGSNGIYLASASTAANLTVSNNFISDVASQGFNGVTSSDNGYGIMIDTGGGYKLFHNSVLLNTNQGSGAASGITAGLNISSSVSAANTIDLRDNIFDNAQTAGTRYGVYVSSNAAIFTDINYNDYFAQNVGFLGSARATLANWQTATGKDANSLANDPQFVTVAAPADLHILPGSSLIDAGTNAGITTDIDGQLRDAKTDMGSDEIPIPPVLASGATITYTENDPATPIAAGITVNDANSPSLASAVITMTNYVSGQDVLSFTNVSGMGNVAIASNTAGVLTLTSSGASATVAEWQAALRAVKYSNTSETPNTTARAVTFVINDGYYNSNTLGSTINVTAVNDLPVAQASSVTTNEDTAKTFAVANFPFTDAEGDPLASITVSNLTLASGDTLKVDQGSGLVDVTNGMTITAAQIPSLVYGPAANGNGAARSTFKFAVNDADPGTVTATMTINVTPVNDIPVAQPSSVTTDEDVAKTFAVADFQYTDLEGDALVSIKVGAVTLASGDTLKVDQGAGLVNVTNGMTITAAQIPTMVYTSPLNVNGNARSTFDFKVNDADTGTVSATMTINVAAVNDAPVAQPNTVTANEDVAKSFTKDDFPYTDIESDALKSITIGVVTNASGDTLKVDQGSGMVNVTNGMTITLAQIPTLTYLSALNANGAGRSSFTFTVNDDDLGTVSATLTIDVTAVNDAPVAQPSGVTTNEDTAKALAVSDFQFTDLESDALTSITVSALALASGDTLTVDQGAGPVAVTTGMTITAAQIPTLTYTPAPNANGTGRSTLDFMVNDADLGTVSATMTIDVTPVNDAPVAAASSVTANEDTAKTFAVSDFNYTDLESDSLTSIAVVTVTLASGDTLTVDLGAGPVAVSNGMTISAAQIPTLTYTPAPNANGLARSAFTFKVNDADPGTVSATMTINVTAVNDVPVAQPSSVTTNEDTAKTFAVSDFNFTDLESNGLVAIEMVALNLASGDSLTVDLGAGVVPVTTGMIIPAAQIPTLTYSPALNANGLARSSFDFTVDDAGQGTVAATMTIDVTAVNDVPVAQPNTVTTNEDTAKTFAVGDFPFTDVEGDGLVAIEIVALNLASGDALTVNLGAGTVPVTTGMIIPAAQIPTLTYMPASDANGLARSSFDFTVDDAGQGTDPGTMTINVTPVNDAPVAQPNSVTTNEDTAKTFALGDFPFTDAEGNGLVAIEMVALNLASGDTLTVNLGAGTVPVTTGMIIPAARIPTLTYTPALNANGLARSTFDFTVDDADLGTAAATMTINVTAVNDVPVAQASNIMTNQDIAKVFAVSDFLFADVEGDALVSVTVSNLNLAAGDTLTVNQGAGPVAVTNGMTITAAQIATMTYTPAPGGFGTPRSLFDFTVNDAGLGTVSATMSVNTTQLSDIQFQSPTFTTGEDGVTMAHVVVTRTASSGPVSVNFTTSPGGTATSAAVGANPQDYTTTTQTVSWAAGDFTPKTVDIPINDDTLNEGRETINLTLSSPTGNARLGATSTAVLSIMPSDGIAIDGLAKKPQGTSTDSDGDIITMKLTGKVGTLAFYRTDPDGDGKGPIELIVVSGTDPAPGKPVKAALTITTAKPKGGAGDGFVNVGAITGSTLKSITAKKSDLDGDGINMTGYVGAVTFKDVKNGADILLNGTAPTAKSAVKIKVGVVGDGTTIDVKAPVASLAATKIGIGNITAPSIGTLTVSGKPASKTAAAIPGDFASDLTLSGVGVLAGKPTLKTMTVKGAVSNAVIDVTGAITSITVGSFLNSRLYASYAGPDDGSGVFTAGGDVGTFKVTGKSNAFAHSFVIASNFKNVSLASIDPDNSGTKFGVTANDVVKALTVTASKFKYNAKTGGTQDLTGTDFEVKVI